MRATPHPQPEEKDRYVRAMFNDIAGRYDTLNHVLSLNLDKAWRRRTVDLLDPQPDDAVLDLGTGTGDLAFEAARRTTDGRVVGLDVTENMIRLGREKRDEARLANVRFVQGSALAIPLPGGAFDGVTTAFTLRNVSDLPQFFQEAHRVLRPGGRLASLEIARPEGRVLGSLFSLYFHHIMPRIGRALSRSPEAYTYLSESVKRVESPKEIARVIRSTGFQNVEVHAFAGGMVVVHTATKRVT